MPLKVVLDTNVVVSAMLKTSGLPAEIFECFLEGRFAALISPPIIYEYENVLLRKRLGLSGDTVHEAMSNFRKAAVMVYPDIDISVCGDSSDNKFLSCAVYGGADYLVTGNLRHFPKSLFMTVRIVSPRDFIKNLP